MTKKFSALLLCSILFAFQYAPAQAWEATGHRVVARVADRYLSPKARRGVENLLNPGENLPDISVWADEFRLRPEGKHTNRWHVVFFSPGTDAYDARRDCPAVGCIVKAIEDQMAVLPDRSSARQDRRRVLKFLLHLVGDIHQPLHAGRFEDRGGGLIRVKYFGKQLTLHKLWDSTFIDRTGLTEAELTKKAIQASSASSFGGTPADWANESHRLAISHTYQLEDGGEINGKYEQDSLMVIYRRLGQAGTRLAHLLNKAFHSKTSSSGF